MSFSVTKNGEPLSRDLYVWNVKSRTFSTLESDLVLDFSSIDDIAFKTGSHCSFYTGSGCMFDAGLSCSFKTGSHCIFKTGSGCMFDAGSGCTFNAGPGCTFKTGSHCTFKTGSHCAFNTGEHCTFDTGSGCTFKTESGCVFDTSSGCVFNTGEQCVAIRRDIFQILQLNGKEMIQFCPFNIKGYITKKHNDEYFRFSNGDKAIIADNVLSKIISKRKVQDTTIYKVINHGSNKETYLMERNNFFAHGLTLTEAKNDLIYKITDKDTSEYGNFNLDTVLSKDDAIKMYRTVTGACSQGVKEFVENLEDAPDKVSIAKIIELTKNQYGNSDFEKFFMQTK